MSFINNNNNNTNDDDDDDDDTALVVALVHEKRPRPSLGNQAEVRISAYGTDMNPYNEPEDLTPKAPLKSGPHATLHLNPSKASRQKRSREEYKSSHEAFYTLNSKTSVTQGGVTISLTRGSTKMPTN